MASGAGLWRAGGRCACESSALGGIFMHFAGTPVLCTHICCFGSVVVELTLSVRAGAAAVEGSERMAATARSIIKANGLDAASGGPIEVVAGRLEDLDLPVDQARPRHRGPARMIGCTQTGHHSMSLSLGMPSAACSPRSLHYVVLHSRNRPESAACLQNTVTEVLARPLPL